MLFLSSGLLALLILGITSALIAFDLVHRTVAALIGALLVVHLHILTPEVAISYISMETLLLLLGMMIILSVTDKTGFFQWFTLKLVIWSGRSLWKLLLIVSFATAILSAFLDNVTTVLLIGPMVLEIALFLEINPIPFLLCIAFASNIGGAATLIGDPPNIMIGAVTNLSFLEFIVNLGPIIAINIIVFYIYIYFVFSRLIPVVEIDDDIIEQCEAHYQSHQTPYLYKGVAVLLLTLFGFFIHGFIHIPPYIVALTGGTLILLVTKISPEKALRDIEWSTLVFFAALFIVVGGVQESGVISIAAHYAVSALESNLSALLSAIVFFSAIGSAIMSNVPFTAAMLPLIDEINKSFVNDGLWWALSLGACLGGNASLISASANIVVAGLSERSGYPISFMEFFKYGFPLTILTLITSATYLVIFYT